MTDALQEASLPLRMAVAMETELDANSHKTGWANMTPRQLLNRLRQEAMELERAVGRGDSPESVWSEAADVANFAAMVADVYQQKVEDETDDAHP